MSMSTTAPIDSHIKASRRKFRQIDPQFDAKTYLLASTQVTDAQRPATTRPSAAGPGRYRSRRTFAANNISALASCSRRFLLPRATIPSQGRRRPRRRGEQRGTADHRRRWDRSRPSVYSILALSPGMKLRRAHPALRQPGQAGDRPARTRPACNFVLRDPREEKVAGGPALLADA